MKKILFLAFIIIIMNANAQITLEHTYENASTLLSGNPVVNSQLMIVNFEVSGEKYVIIDRWNKEIRIYNLNHSLVKNISLANIPKTDYYNLVGDILYLSENLFNTDPKIEYMYVYDTVINTEGSWITNIYNEDGVLLFSENGVPLVKLNIPMQQYPIYNTSAGTKMILSYNNEQAKVFSLPGTLTTAIKNNTNELINENENNFLSNPFPNPSSNETRIQYKLPNGTNQGDIVFYNLQGSQIKSFTVDRSFDYLSISTADIAAGTYYYRLETNTQNTEGKKLVVIK